MKNNNYEEIGLIFDLIKVIYYIKLNNLDEKLRNEIYLICNYLALKQAIWRNFSPIIDCFYKNALTLCESVKRNNSDFYISKDIIEMEYKNNLKTQVMLKKSK